MNDNAINALLLTLIAGGATSIGAMLTFFVKQHNFRVLALGMSFSAGVMIYLSFMDILPMAIENMSASNEASKLGHILAVVTFFIGVFIAGIIDHFVPEHLNSDDDPKHNKKNYASKKAHRAAILTALALAIHNFPEGFSVFVSSIENITVGIGVAIAIILHNIPEGVSVAMPIYSATGNRAKAFWIATASGMAEPLGALVAYNGDDYMQMRKRTFSMLDELITFDVESMDAEAQPGELYIDSIAVVPNARGKGIARQLLQYGIGVAQEMHLPAILACEPNNLGAKALYESLGFKHEGDLFIFCHHYLRMVSE